MLQLYVDEFESDREVSDNSGSYFSDKSNTKTISSVTPDKLSDNSAGLKLLHVDFYAKSFQKKIRETVTSQSPKYTTSKKFRESEDI